MSWVITSRGTVQSLNSAANTVISSFTPGANKLLVVWFAGEANPTSLSGHGTWSQIGSSLAWGASAIQTLRLYACKTSGSPGASAVTLTHSAVWYRAAGCIEFDENVLGLPATVAGCFGTLVTMSTYTAASGAPFSLGVTLGAFADPNNLVLQVGAGNSGGTLTMTEEGGYSVAHSVGTAEVQVKAAYKTTADTSPGMTATNTSTYFASMAVEVKMNTASSGVMRPASSIGTGGMQDMGGGMQGKAVARSRDRIIVPANFYALGNRRGVPSRLRF